MTRADPRAGSGDGRPVLSPEDRARRRTAANLWAANVGSETSGSILTPANATMRGWREADRRPISRYG
jgi:amidase